MDLKGAFSIVLFLGALFLISDARKQHCSLCQPGWGLTRLCSPSRPTLCHLCPPKTYSPRQPHLSECTPCSKCGEGLYEEKKCTRFHDTKCDSCDTVNGKYNEDFITKCQKSNKIAHENPASPLGAVDDDFFDIDVFGPSELSLSDKDYTNQDSDESFWNDLDSAYEDSKPWSSDSEDKDSKFWKNLADLDVIPNPNVQVNIKSDIHRNEPLSVDLPIDTDDRLTDSSEQVFQPIRVHNGIQRYTPLPLSPPKGINEKSANRLPFLNMINGLQRYTPLPLNVRNGDNMDLINRFPNKNDIHGLRRYTSLPLAERKGGNHELMERLPNQNIINGLGRYTPLPLKDHRKGDRIKFNKLADLFEPFDAEARLHTQIDDGFGELKASMDKLFDEPSTTVDNDLAADVLEPLEPAEDMPNALGMKKILPFWPYFEKPAEGPEMDPHHRFVENDGDKFVGHRLIRVKPSTRALDMMKLLRAQHRRFYVLSGVACAVFLATLIFLGVMLRRCWRSADTDWNSRYQQLQLQLSPSDNKIIKDCAAKFDTSAMLDRLRRQPGDTDHQPLIQIQENPMALVHYLELNSSEESLP